MWPFSTAPSTSDTTQASAPPSACPVDHSTREEWLKSNPGSTATSGQQQPPRHVGAAGLSTDREISSIPRWLPNKTLSDLPSSSASATSAAADIAASDKDVPPTACPARSEAVASAATSAEPADKEEKWVYPSPSSFYSALQRKNRPADARDMDIVVPIHNAVNERVWEQVLEWERDALGLSREERVGSKLVSFVGRPKDVSPRARWKTLIGYTAPFDRHDWIIDRPISTGGDSSTPQSQRIRYVIDFYTGRGNPLLAAAGAEAGVPPANKAGGGGGMPNLAFYIDCRPALDDYEGVRMRAGRFWKSWFPAASNQSGQPSSAAAERP